MTITPSFALTQTEVAKLLASDGANEDEFGASVSIDGDTAVIGSQLDDDNGLNSGSAYVFVRNAGTWTEQTKLLASDGAQADRFGSSVSVSGNTIVIGASEASAAYVFVQSNGVWTEQAKLQPNNGHSNDRFGSSVSVDGNTAVIGSPFENSNAITASGSAFVFVRSAGVWIQQTKLSAIDGSEQDRFGLSVSVNGNTAVIGVERDDDNGIDSGSAYVFVRNAGVWTEQAKLLASDGGEFDYFGRSVSVDGNTAVIGAFLGDNKVFDSSGSAYVFVRNAGVWTEQAKLLASDGEINDQFGWSVSIDENIAVIGARLDENKNGLGAGAAYVFIRNAGLWIEQAKLLPSDGKAQDVFGTSVSVNSTSAIIGAPRPVTAEPGPGSAYVYDAAISVDIDIKPDDDTNSIDLRSEVDVWVAILSNIDPDSPFDPLAQVDIPTVEFGPNKANAIGQGADDINNDGLDDLLLRFNIAESGLTIGNSNAILSGLTFAGLLFIGSDGVVVFMSSGGGGGGSFYLLPLLLLVLIAIKKLDNKLHLLKYF